MRVKGILSIVGVVALTAGCADDRVTDTALPQGEALYAVSFNATWSATTHPDGFPPNPHFSSLAGATHSATGMIRLPIWLQCATS